MGAGRTPLGRLALVSSLVAGWSTLAAQLVGGCGSGGDEDRLRSAVIGLDFTPNAVHRADLYGRAQRL
jgi:hypothetical protein